MTDDPVIVRGGPEEVRAAVLAGASRVVAVVEGLDRRRASVLLDAGAAGVVLAEKEAETLMAAVAAVRAGLVVLPEEGRHAVQRPVLTVRQQQVAGLMVIGLGNAEIARRLHLTESTVKTHVRSILTKFGVRSRKEAIDLVMDPGSEVGRGILSLGGGTRRGGYETPRVS